MYMNDKLPVASARERPLMRLKKPKLIDYEEMCVPKVDMNKEPQDTLDKIWDVQKVKGHHYDQAAKKWGKWMTRKIDKNTSKQQRDQRLLESQPELFAPENQREQPPKR
jgi:hypothetical protein